MGVKLAAQRAEPPRAVFIESANAPGSLHSGKTMEALAEIQFAAGAPGEGVDVLMRVTGAEAGEDDFSCISSVIVVGVANVNQIAAVPDVGATVAKRKTGWHVQPVGIGDDLVGVTVGIGIFKDENFVVGRFAWFELRIRPGAKHPKSAMCVPTKTDRIGDAHRLVGEQFDT